MLSVPLELPPAPRPTANQSSTVNDGAEPTGSVGLPTFRVPVAPALPTQTWLWLAGTLMLAAALPSTVIVPRLPLLPTMSTPLSTLTTALPSAVKEQGFAPPSPMETLAPPLLASL